MKTLNNQPLVSIIMNCYNSDTYLKEAIDSVFAQTYQNWEIIFWDNQSTDKSAEIVKSYDDRIKYFYASEHTGLGEGRNHALEKVNGEFFSFLDCDDIIDSKKIEIQVDVFLKNSEVDFVYSNGCRINDKGEKKTVFSSRALSSGNIFRETLGHYDIYIPTVMIRKSIVEENSITFNKNYKYIEEYDFFLRVLFFTQAKYIDQELAYWRVHGESDTWNNYEKFSDEREDFLEKFFNTEILKNRYKNEIEAVKKFNIYQEAIFNWKQGNNKVATKLMNKIKFFKSKYLLIFILVHINYKILYPIISKFKYIK